jgi:DNA-binding CsgD family transcriptional regulator
MNDRLFECMTAFARRHKFSKRETTVFIGLVNYGTKHEELAEELEISPNTLRIHLRNMNQKAGTAGISSLLREFIGFGFSQPVWEPATKSFEPASWATASQEQALAPSAVS